MCKGNNIMADSRRGERRHRPLSCPERKCVRDSRDPGDALGQTLPHPRTLSVPVSSIPAWAL